MKITQSGTINEVIEGKLYNYDYYHMEVRTGLSTKEYQIVVDFEKKTITGDGVAYGGFITLDKDECISFLNYVDKPIRNFTKIIKDGN